ncbi:Crp/Fnr family transcriptional regulator [Arcticibacter tournemirensis]|uniref:Crp/Fnr family transcriptional regulator n=1 Tax=Arcticibacter tournemirensis TaxID=699437 RepID=A0A4Q0M748_9SPHI|nr:Crp/Fnr family transcriptional regulator [Arcticibacter tournemirensis]RXF68589.1 Crp/Fnr family transcriptional regulator [Arcticibacter tournemirensis]
MNRLITTIRTLIRITADEEVILTGLFKPLKLKSGEYFLEEGQLCRYVGFIEEGLVRYHMNDNGNQKTLYFNKEGEFVSNYQSFLPREPSNTSIQAIEDTAMQVINYADLQRLYSNVSEGEKLGRLAIENVFLSSLQQLKSFYKDSPTERYQQFLRSYPSLVQRIPQYHIASYVGIKPQSLSRIRRKLVHKNDRIRFH